MAADSTTQPEPNAARQRFPIVGIGASAGGIEAFTALFDAMPATTGMGFVLIQHLPPERESLVAEIIGKHTSMPVRQVEEGVLVEPGHVYVIRPGHTMTIDQGRLHLGEPVEKRGHRRPVDDFFRSLAREQGDRSIIIILSGMGSNGTAGAQAIKAAGGICIAQDPETAQFSSMPRSLIDAGYADHVLRPSDIPDLLLKYVHHPYMEGGEEANEAALRRDRQSFNEILAMLRTRTNYEFSGYKKHTLHRRIQRRMGVNQITQLGEYTQLLRKKPEEVQSLANDLLINVTGFFRDPEAWEALRTQVIAPMIADRPDGGAVRAWVTACASGEEPYTLAMLITGEAERLKKRLDVKIFATDAAEKSLMHARAGVYPAGIEGDVSPERLDQYFDKEEQAYRIKKEIREMVVFAPQNLLSDPPFSRLDIACCRNLLIYLEPDVQRRVISLLHFALRDGGCLFLGNSETIGTAEELFDPLNKKWRIYRRVGATRRGAVDLLKSSRAPGGDERAAEAEESPSHPSLGLLAQRALLERYTPPSVVVDRMLTVLYFHGATAPFLLQPSGEPTRNLLELCREGVRAAVRVACREAMRSNHSVTVPDGRIETERGIRRITVTAAPLARASAREHLLVSFAELPEAPPAALLPDGSGVSTASATDVQRQMEDELRTVREELQSTIEEMESSNEELKASNEEVTSINEELQSSNEELETSKEELQSLNEELTTVNSQLQNKIEELEGTTNDLTNLLSSTDIAVIFLDTSFRIRRFTPAVKDLLELIPSDTGRPLSDLAQKFTDTHLMADARSVLERLVPIEREIPSDNGSWYQRRALPYRTADNRIDGVVITFVDITDRKNAEQTVVVEHSRSQAVLEQMPAAVLIVDAVNGKLMLANHRVSQLFGSPYPFPLISADWMSVFAGFKGFFRNGMPYGPEQWPIARSLAAGEAIVDEEIEFIRPDDSRWTLSSGSSPVLDDDGKAIAVVATFWDMTERKRAENQLRDSEERFRLLVDGAADYAIFMLDPDGKIATWNRGGERLLGYSEAEIVGRPAAILFTPEDRAAGAAELEMTTALKTGHAAHDRWQLRKDGTRFWASGAMSPLKEAGAAGRRGFVKVLRDNTDRKRAEDALQHAKAAAEAANLAKDDFVATLSHELRTPLSAILLWTKMLRANGKSDQHMRDGLEIILQAAGAQQQLIDDLLDVARMASGKLRIVPRATRLSSAVESALRAISPAAESHGVTITTDIAPTVGVVRADPDRLQQVLWNLLINAVKFTPSGGNIRVQLLREGNLVEMVVTDNGVGIRPELLPYIFDRFRQGEAGTTRLHGGLGLGLTIARQLVELHAGTIEVTSEGEGRGATFRVRLPLPSLTGPPSELDQATGLSLSPAEGRLHGIRILLVEDDAATRDAIRTLIAHQGAQVTCADSTAGAVREFAMRVPEIVISDIAMPGQDGYALVRQIRAMEKERNLPPTPALAMTAFARGDDRQRAVEAGFNDLMPKPIDAEALIRTIADVAAGNRK